MSSEITKAKDLVERSDEELAQFLVERREDLFKMRFQHYTSGLENTAGLKHARRDIARALTLETQRHPEAAEPSTKRGKRRAAAKAKAKQEEQA